MKEILLQLPAFIYGAITSLRNYCFDKEIFKSYRSKLPVLSVGNITAGGNGKTPFVIYLCQLMQELGKRPVVLSRGYGGSERGPYLLKEDENIAKVGDEPVLIAKRADCQVVISRSRVKGAQFIEGQNLGDVIILDDGFQHRWLQRDVDIVCIFTGTEKARSEFREGKLLPLGRFREEKKKALKRASSIILINRSLDLKDYRDEISLKQICNVPVFNARMTVKISPQLNPQPVCVVSAIANPEGFFETLEGTGFTIAEKRTYSDHYHYTEKDVEYLKESKLPIVCTEKDWVKLKAFHLIDLHVVAINLSVESKEDFINSFSAFR